MAEDIEHCSNDGVEIIGILPMQAKGNLLVAEHLVALAHLILFVLERPLHARDHALQLTFTYRPLRFRGEA